MKSCNFLLLIKAAVIAVVLMSLNRSYKAATFNDCGSYYCINFLNFRNDIIYSYILTKKVL